MKNSMCTGSALPSKGLILKGTLPKSTKGTLSKSKERLLKYKTFAEAFSYPKVEDLRLEYDRLFRQSELWLYGAEYKIKNEFQRAQDLADINGFYRAFGLETDKDRPDSLPCELEFMHYLIFKELNAQSEEKSFLCQDAQKKFFREHLYPAAIKICSAITSHTENNFFLRNAKQLLEFLESENKLFAGR